MCIAEEPGRQLLTIMDAPRDKFAAFTRYRFDGNTVRSSSYTRPKGLNQSTVRLASSATVKGVLYNVDRIRTSSTEYWLRIRRFNGCEFEEVERKLEVAGAFPFGDRNSVSLCTEWNGKLVICVGKTCGQWEPADKCSQKWDTEGEAPCEGTFSTMASLANAPWRGKMILASTGTYSAPMVIAPAVDLSQSRVIEYYVKNNWYTLYTRMGETLDEMTGWPNYVYNMRTAVHDSKIFMFEPTSQATSEPKHYEYSYSPWMGSPSFILTKLEALPESELYAAGGRDAAVNPTVYDSTGGHGYIIHHRPYNCGQSISADKYRFVVYNRTI